MTLVPSPRIIARVLAVIIACLLLGHVTTQLLKHVRGHDHQRGLAAKLDLDAEINIPSWYASSSLLLCSILLVVVARAKRRVADRHAGRWLGLAAVFLLMSLDEAAGLHELTITPLRNATGATGYFTFAWVIPGGLLALALGLGYLRFLADLPARTRALFVLAGAVYLGGVLGMEMLSGKYHSLYGYRTLAYSMLVAGEEGLEMAGVAIFLYALVSYLGTHVGAIQLAFGERADRP